MARTEYLIEHLECRDWGHSWEIAYLTRDSDGVLIRRLNCTRCDTGRFDYLTKAGHVVGRTYRYAELYLDPGHGRFDKAAVRKQVLVHLLNDPAYRIKTSEQDDLPNRRLLDG